MARYTSGRSPQERQRREGALKEAAHLFRGQVNKILPAHCPGDVQKTQQKPHQSDAQAKVYAPVATGFFIRVDGAQMPFYVR